MLAARIHGPNDLRLDSIELAPAGAGDVVLDVRACGICGTDLRYVRQGGLIGPTDAPMPLGHELVGVVQHAGEDVLRQRPQLAPGARVVLNPTANGHMIGNGGTEGGFARRLLVRDAANADALFPVPEDMPDEIAALSEPLGVGMNAVDRSGAAPGERVAVFGAGPIGLACVAALVDRGLNDIAVIDLSATRLAIAGKLGAAETIDASACRPFDRLREVHGEASVLGAPMAGTDAYIDATGSGDVIRRVIRHAKANARLTVVALHGDDVPVSFLTVMMKQLTIRGAMEYGADFGRTIDLLSRRDLSAMVTHRFGLADIAAAFDTARDPDVAGKVIVNVGDTGAPQGDTSNE